METTCSDFEWWLTEWRSSCSKPFAIQPKTIRFQMTNCIYQTPDDLYSDLQNLGLFMTELNLGAITWV